MKRHALAIILAAFCCSASALEECSGKGIQGCGPSPEPPDRKCPQGSTCPRLKPQEVDPAKAPKVHEDPKKVVVVRDPSKKSAGQEPVSRIPGEKKVKK